MRGDVRDAWRMSLCRLNASSLYLRSLSLLSLLPRLSLCLVGFRFLPSTLVISFRSILVIFYLFLWQVNPQYLCYLHFCYLSHLSSRYRNFSLSPTSTLASHPHSLVFNGSQGFLFSSNSCLISYYWSQFTLGHWHVLVASKIVVFFLFKISLTSLLMSFLTTSSEQQM